MLKHTVATFTVALAGILLLGSRTPAQPGPDGVKKLEAELEKLRDQVKETEAKLAKAKEAAKGRGGFEGKGKFPFDGKGKFPFGDKKGFERGKGSFGKGGFGPKGFEFKKKEEPKKEAGKEPAVASKLDPATIREKYAFYKKLYDELPKDAPKGGFGSGFKGKGPFTKSPEANSVEARLDRLVRELEDLRRDLKKR